MERDIITVPIVNKKIPQVIFDEMNVVPSPALVEYKFPLEKLDEYFEYLIQTIRGSGRNTVAGETALRLAPTDVVVNSLEWLYDGVELYVNIFYAEIRGYEVVSCDVQKRVQHHA